MNWIAYHGISEGLSGFGTTTWHSNWKLIQSDRSGEELPARVPGNVQWDLQLAKKIPDPFVGRNNEQAKWIADVSWDYVNQFNLNEWQQKVLAQFPQGGLLHLIFDAIDYDAQFFINNNFIAQHIGSFSPITLTTGIRADSNVSASSSPSDLPIRIHFSPQPWWRQHAVKCQMAFGWDFAPEIRTVGLWKPIRIAFSGPAYFSHIRIHADPQIFESNAISLSNLAIQGIIKVHHLDSLKEEDSPQSFELRIKTEDFEKTYAVSTISGKYFELNLGQLKLPLWNPWSVGEPHQIPIQLQLVWNGLVCDEYRGTIINRKVEWLRNPGSFPGNENWTFKINNHVMFLRGMNWVPPDSIFGRISNERYYTLLDQTKALGIDILRVWGGGIEEHSAFYDYCDQQGILVWQEFPFACTNYPRDPRYLEIATTECENLVKRVARHPSVVVYCGGNEFNPYINRHIIDLVQTAVSKYSPDCHCFAASPFLGDDHNWKFWGARSQLSAFDINGRGPFQMLTEFGMQAAPQLETLKQCLSNPKEDQLLQMKEELKYHKADMDALFFYAKSHGKEIRSLADLIRISEALQAYALKYAIETCRGNWPNVSGVFPWQLSDPWPNCSWSIIDYNLTPKLGAKMVKLVYSPILPMIRYWKAIGVQTNKNRWRTGEIIVHNATQYPFDGMIEVILERTEMNASTGSNQAQSTLLYSGTKSFKVSPHRAIRIGTIKLQSLPQTRVRLRIFDTQQHLIVMNFSFPAMEPLIPRLKRLYAFADVKFDGWWRKHMIRLMEVDRMKTDFHDWNQKRANRQKNR